MFSPLPETNSCYPFLRQWSGPTSIGNYDTSHEHLGVPIFRYCLEHQLMILARSHAESSTITPPSPTLYTLIAYSSFTGYICASLCFWILSVQLHIRWADFLPVAVSRYVFRDVHVCMTISSLGQIYNYKRLFPRHFFTCMYS